MGISFKFVQTPKRKSFHFRNKFKDPDPIFEFIKLFSIRQKIPRPLTLIAELAIIARIALALTGHTVPMAVPAVQAAFYKYTDRQIIDSI